MSPEKNQSRSEKAINADVIELGLRTHYIAEKLTSGSPVEIPKLKNRNELMNVCQNEDEGVIQGLRAEIKAGNEIFGIVDVFVKLDDGVMEGTAITRSVPNQRAELVSFINPDGITEIGRKHNSGLDSTVSGNHLALSFNKNGSMNIMDMGSTNGTNLYRHRMHEPKDSAIEDPTNNIDNWSLKSEKIKKIMLDSIE